MHSPKQAALPAPVPAPPPPTVDQAAESARQDQTLRSRRGAAASVLAGTNPQAPTTGPATKLLGM